MNSLRFFAPLDALARACVCEIEVSSTFQLPVFQIIGLPSREVSEAKERIRAAIIASGLEFPKRRITVNLAPAEIPKSGTALDLAIATALIYAGRPSPAKSSRDSNPPLEILLGGALSLQGTVTPTRRPLRALHAARERGISNLILHPNDLAVIHTATTPSERRGLQLYAVRSLGDALTVIEQIGKREDGTGSMEVMAGDGEDKAPPTPSATAPVALPPLSPSIQRVCGLALAGAHHLMLLGPRGSGKSTALEWMAKAPPPQTRHEQMEHLLLAELRGQSETNIRRVGTELRPEALLGSIRGQRLLPGELTLAHGGILMADEFPEWSRDARECLRGPLERGRLELIRVGQRVELPARFVWVATGNLCPCGQDGSQTTGGQAGCRCLENERHRYRSRLSGPILDRADLILRISGGPMPTGQTDPSAHTGHPNDTDDTADAANWFEQIRTTRERLLDQYSEWPGVWTSQACEAYLSQNPEGREQLARLSHQSLRDRHKTLKISITLAAWEGRERPSVWDFKEAQTLRGAWLSRNARDLPASSRVLT